MEMDRPHVYLARIQNRDTRQLITHPNPTPAVDKVIIEQEVNELLEQQQDPTQWDMRCQLQYTDELGGVSE